MKSKRGSHTWRNIKGADARDRLLGAPFMSSPVRTIDPVVYEAEQKAIAEIRAARPKPLIKL